jgi:excisionase family DNA binding protein
VPTATATISQADAAARLHVSVKTIRRRIAEGTLTAYRVGPKLIRLDPAEVDALLRPIPTAGTAA